MHVLLKFLIVSKILSKDLSVYPLLQLTLSLTLHCVTHVVTHSAWTLKAFSVTVVTGLSTIAPAAFGVLACLYFLASGLH